MKALLASALCLIGLSSYGQPLIRQFFTTNPAPIVDVVAGSNATVQASTPNAQTRRFTVNAVPAAGTGQTNNTIVVAGTNIVVTSVAAGGDTTYTVYGLTDTNVVRVLGTNVAAYQAQLATNALAAANSNLFVFKYGDTVSGPILTTSASSNAPAQNELATGGWVRSLFNNGVIDYVTTNIDGVATNLGSPNQFVYQFWQGVIPQPSTRVWVSAFLTNNGYVGSVITTNTFSFLAGPVAINSYLGLSSGGGDALTVHPEIYYSYDKTNWYGDWEAQGQALTPGRTNLYQFIISFPAITATNSSGFYLQRRFKVNSFGGTPTLYVLVGTNNSSGTLDASHISFSGPNSAIGNAYLANNQTFTGSNQFSGGMMVWGDSNKTNGVWVGPAGEVLSNNLGSVTIAGGNVTASGTFTGNGSGVTNLPVSSLNASGIMGKLIINPFTGAPFWLTNDGSLYVLETFQTGDPANPGYFVLGTGSGGISFTASSTLWGPTRSFLRTQVAATNSAAYGNVRIPYSTACLTNSFFISSSGIFPVSGDATNVLVWFGAANTVSSATATDSIRWLYNWSWSSNWVAECMNSSSATRYTSSIPVWSNSTSLTISAPYLTNVTFSANGVPQWTNAVNVPIPPRAVLVGHSMLSLSTTGSTTPCLVFIYDLLLWLNGKNP